MKERTGTAGGNGGRRPRKSMRSLALEECLESLSPGEIELLLARLASLTHPHAAPVKTDEPSCLPVGTEASPTGGKQVHILIADDDQMISELLGRILRQKGWAVETVPCGREALARSEAEEFDLILMDLQMPDMDGLETARAIRNREANDDGHVPIIALTAHGLPEDRKDCLSAGMDGVLVKPVSMARLYAEIEGHLAKNNRKSPPFPGATLI